MLTFFEFTFKFCNLKKIDIYDNNKLFIITVTNICAIKINDTNYVVFKIRKLLYIYNTV